MCVELILGQTGGGGAITYFLSSDIIWDILCHLFNRSFRGEAVVPWSFYVSVLGPSSDIHENYISVENLSNSDLLIGKKTLYGLILRMEMPTLTIS